MTSAGQVYLLQSGGTNRFKIGRTASSPEKRRRTLATGNPDDLREVKSWHLPDRHGEFERLAHAAFSAERIVDADATEFFVIDAIGPAVTRLDALHTEFLQQVAADAAVHGVPQSDDTRVPPDEAVLGLIGRRRALRARVQLLQFQCATIDAQLKQAILGHAGVAGAGERLLVSWRTVSTTRFDHAAFKRKHPDLTAEFTNTACARRFCVAP
jgi:hypothetical protein